MNDLNSLYEDPYEDPYQSPIDEDADFEQTTLWIISFSDFMTILMIFFLMLFAHRLWAKTVTWENKKVMQLRAAQEAQKGMIERLNRLAEVNVQAERIDIHLPDALLFDAGRADLRTGAQALLGRIAPELSTFHGDIVVEGHTDDLPTAPNSKFKSNWELSVARAFSVITCLTELGVNPASLSARGYGPYRPRALNDTPEHRAENRRIEIVLLNERKEDVKK
jgi:flagellar motor protein MotB